MLCLARLDSVRFGSVGGPSIREGVIRESDMSAYMRDAETCKYINVTYTIESDDEEREREEIFVIITVT